MIPKPSKRRRCRRYILYLIELFVVASCSAFVSPFSTTRIRHCSYQTAGSFFDSLTVKELRQLVKETSNERGVLSRLKRKQELVEYLEKSQKKPRKLPPMAPLDNSVTNITSSPKDAIFEQVYERYPSVKQQQSLQIDYTDVRQLYHPMVRQAQNSDMDVCFVGTASCTPGVTRGVSCTALRLNWKRRAAFHINNNHHATSFQGGTWLFDTGECTQLQIQRTTAVKPSKITKIFLTHAHGDHSFGLPGLLCLMGQDRNREESPPVEIYGPEGLRMWLRVAIRYSVSRIVPPYRVHEILHIPMAPEWEFNSRARRFFYRGFKKGDTWGTKGLSGEDSINWISQANGLKLEPSPMYGEIEGGRDIFPIYDHSLSSDGAPVWEVEDEDDVKVYAAPMSHSIPCLGYVVEEMARPGRLRNELVEPIVRRNVDALKEAGFAIPMKAMAVIKNLPPGNRFTFPDGTVVTQEEAVEPPRKGRKVVICGDTCDSRAMRNLAQDADLVIHECTNCYLPGVDKDTSLQDVSRDAVIHGHSTPQIAGDFAKSVNAKRLVLNHFSARYKGDVSADSLSLMMRIEKQAMKASGLKEDEVAAAWDLMVLPVPSH